MIWDYIKIGAIITASLTNFLIGFVVFRNSPRNRINIFFFFICLSMGLWGFCLLFYQFASVFSSLFWIKATYISASVCTGLIFLFSFIFPKPIFRQFWFWAGLFGAAFLGFTFWLLFFTKLWIIDVILDPLKGLQTLWGVGYYWWLLALWIAICWSLVNSVANSRNSSGLQKLQLRYFFYVFGIFCAIVCIPDVIIPIFFHTTAYFYISAIFSLIFSGAVGYSILKHRLMDVHLLVARSIAYFFLIVSLAAIYSLGLFSFSVFITKEPSMVTSLVVSTLFAVLIAFSFQPLLAFFQKITNRIFFKGRYNATDLLHELILIMAANNRLHDLAKNLLFTILTKMRISRGAFVLLDNNKVTYIHERYKSEPKFNEKDLDEIIKSPKIVVFDELPESPFKEILRRLEISIIVPLRTKTEQEDVLILGGKLAGEAYTIQDIKLLEIFAPVAAVAIANASGVDRLLRLDETKSEFIAVVSHQLRTPLSIARWNFELLLEKSFGKLPVKIEEIIKTTYHAMMSINQGINNLMSTLEIEEGKGFLKPENIEINREIIKKAVDGLKNEIQSKNIKIKKKLSFKDTLNIDRQKILRVFEILLENAVRYSPAGSTVTIAASSQKKGAQNELLVSIEDEGIGVPEGNRELIFQKFFRGEEAKKMSTSGFGLGLFTAKNYVELHGGRLWLDEKQGPGAIFRFSIPIPEKAP